VVRGWSSSIDNPALPGLDRAAETFVGCDLLRLGATPDALEIGVDGQIDRGAQRREMVADIVEVI